MLLSVVVIVAMLGSVSAAADVITFPVGTPVITDAQHFDNVQRPPFLFRRFGGLSINTLDTNGLHPGGLRVQPNAAPGLQMLSITAAGQAFRFERITAVEQNSTTGFQLRVMGRERSTGLTFEQVVYFDLNMQTYDEFDLLGLDARFGDVVEVLIYVYTPVVDPYFLPYILDSVVATVATTTCPGDLNGDQMVDLVDLSTLLAHFGMQSGATPADGDMDEDGDVDLVDLATLLARFGSSC